MSLHTKTTTIITGSLVILTILAGFLLSRPKGQVRVSAAEGSATASVTVPDTCYLSSTNTEHAITAEGGRYYTEADIASLESTVTVTCNDRNGYSVYAVGCSGSSDNCTDSNRTRLIGSNGVNIDTGTSTNGDTSSWAMKLTPVAGTFAPTILSDNNGSFSGYHVVPASATKVATLTSDINVSNSSQFKTAYAVYVSPSQPAGTYTGKVKYTVVHPNYANSDGTIPAYAVTLGFGVNTSSIIIDGTTYTSASATPNLEYGTHTISGTYPSGYEFSSWSSTGNITIADSTSASTTISVTGVGTLTLTGKSSKLYMQDMTFAQCQKNVSNNIGEEVVAYDKRDEGDYTVKYVNGQCWMTQNLRYIWTSSTQLTAALTNVNANKAITVGALTSGDSYTEARVQYNNNTNSGAWYNFCAASAGDTAGCSDSATYSSGYDICPAGWRLPSSSELSNFTPLSTFNAYGYYSGGVLYAYNCNSRCRGGYWSATSYDSTRQYYLYNNDETQFYINNSYLKSYGLNIRCVKK